MGGNSNVVSVNSKCALAAQDKPISNFYAFSLKRKTISRGKSSGQIVQCLSSGNSFLSSYNNYLGKECLRGGKTETLTRLPKLDRMVKDIELFLLGFSTSRLLAPEFSHTAPQTFSKRLSNPIASPPSCIRRHEAQWETPQCRVGDGSVIPEEGAAAASKRDVLWKYQHDPWHTDLNFLYFCGVSRFSQED